MPVWDLVIVEAYRAHAFESNRITTPLVAASLLARPVQLPLNFEQEKCLKN